MGAVVPLGLTLLSAGVSAAGKYQEAKATEAAAIRNREIALQAARDAYERGQAQAGEYRTKGSMVAGAQRALAGASGADVNSGSVAAAQESTRALSEMDALQASNNAAREAYGYRAQADQFSAQAQQARSAGQWGVAGTLLTAGATAGAMGYGMYQDWSKVNPSGSQMVEDVWGKQINKLPRRR